MIASLSFLADLGSNNDEMSDAEMASSMIITGCFLAIIAASVLYFLFAKVTLPYLQKVFPKQLKKIAEDSVSNERSQAAAMHMQMPDFHFAVQQRIQFYLNSGANPQGALDYIKSMKKYPLRIFTKQYMIPYLNTCAARFTGQQNR